MARWHTGSRRRRTACRGASFRSRGIGCPVAGHRSTRSTGCDFGSDSSSQSGTNGGYNGHTRDSKDSTDTKDTKDTKDTEDTKNQRGPTTHSRCLGHHGRKKHLQLPERALRSNDSLKATAAATRGWRSQPRDGEGGGRTRVRLRSLAHSRTPPALIVLAGLRPVSVAPCRVEE